MRREAWKWAAVTMPLAPLVACLYVFFEWLFFVTKPSPTAALRFGDQLMVLAKGPQPVLVPLLIAQAAGSAVSIIRYPRLRGAALVPSALVGGVLLLVLADNFLYTVLGIGIVAGGEVVRVAYSALFAVCIAIAARKLWRTMTAVVVYRGAAAVGLVLAVLLASAPLVASRRPNREPRPGLAMELGEPGSSTALPNIFFLGIDGVDADILSVYGYERPTTPFLVQASEEMLVFENAFSNATRTHGSLVTLLTGRLPFSTRVTFPPTILQGEDAHRHLPQLLKTRGYGTLQVGMRHYADAEDANLLGFDAANYRWQSLEEVRPGRAPIDEAAVFRRAVAERLDERLGRLLGLPPVASPFAHVEGREVAAEWRDDRRVETLVQYFSRAPEPWFVHLHLLDTHCCQYRPRQMHFSGGRTLAVDARDSQILETDGHVQRLFQALRASGRLERTLVVISSDHTSQWKTTERVPLLMRFPGAGMKGRVSANVQLADVAPTMLRYLGMEVPAWMDGQSLLEPSKLDAARPIFGVSDIGRREGVPGLRLLLDSGPPNYGATSVMMIAGSRWYELSLRDGTLTSGPVPGHTGTEAPVVTDADARGMIEARLAAAGFRVNQPQQAEFRR